MSKTFRKDMTGQQFGKWTVIEFIPDNTKKSSWLCECSCKNKTQKIIKRETLLEGTTKSCGCSRWNEEELVGQQFGRWIVLEFYPCSKEKTYWLCKCSCEEQTIRPVRGNDLKTGSSLSCGCVQQERTSEKTTKNLIGQKFGKLTVISRVLSKKIRDEHIIWKCQCECETIIEVIGKNLTSGNTQSCGCINSVGNINIKKILNDNNIDYITEYKFDNLKSNKGYKLRFDFGIIKNNKLQYLIEFDGQQHYQIGFGMSEQEFQELLERDQLKNNYCIQNNIPLIRIPYMFRDTMTIDTLQLETTQFLYIKKEEAQ